MKVVPPSGPETGDIFDPRVTGFLEGKHARIEYIAINGFKVGSMTPFPPNVEAGHYDASHCYDILRATVQDPVGSNKIAHDEEGRQKWETEVTIFHNDLSSTGMSRDERYLIIVDKPTGMRLKVVLPRCAEEESKDEVS